jgi:radical SAM protein with 4Fe4S-binding SPASM domain
MLMNIHMDLLYACDLDCAHCYLDDKKRAQVKTADIIRTLEEAAALGALQVLFSGGEIFLRKDVYTILEAARRLRYHIRLKTHGGNITAEDATRLAELGVSLVDFSIYALDEEVHDTFTRKPGSLKRTLRGIELLRNAGVEVALKCSVTTYNINHYRELFEHFEALGVELTFNGRIRGTNTIQTTTYPLNVPYEEKVNMEMYRYGQAGGPAPHMPAPAPEKSHFCSAGRTMAYVSPDLQVYPCVSFPKAVGDLKETSFREIWTGESELDRVRRTTRADLKICDTCAARSHCSYCPGAAYIESGGDPDTPPEVVCRQSFAKLEAHERYLAGERSRPHAPMPLPRVAFKILNNQPTGTAPTVTGVGCAH